MDFVHVALDTELSQTASWKQKICSTFEAMDTVRGEYLILLYCFIWQHLTHYGV